MGGMSSERQFSQSTFNLQKDTTTFRSFGKGEKTVIHNYKVYKKFLLNYSL